jgi:rubrerythrin
VLEGTLRYHSDTGGWQLDDLDLSEYLDRYRDQRLVLIIAPIGEAEPETYACGVCGFVMNEARECPRC